MEKRIYSLDIIRAIAILMVILNHAVESIFKLETYEAAILYNTLNPVTLIFTIGRLGVPLFLMLTGYLLIHRDFDSPGSIKRFWVHNLLSIIVTWEIWLVLYNIFLAWLNETPFDFISWGRQALFVDKLSITHSWYVPMIIGVYIFLPFLAKAVKNIKLPNLYFLLAICIATLFVVPSINVFYSTFEMDTLSLGVQPLLWASASGTFVFMGHIFYLNTKQEKRRIGIRVPVDITVVVIGVFVTVYLQVLLHQNMSQYNVWYSFFTLPPIAYCLFDLLYLIPLKRSVIVISRLSACSFGIYLTHRPIQMLFEDRFFTQPPDMVAMWALFFISLGISYGLTEGLHFIPYAGELLTRIKLKKFHIF